MLNVLWECCLYNIIYELENVFANPSKYKEATSKCNIFYENPSFLSNFLETVLNYTLLLVFFIIKLFLYLIVVGISNLIINISLSFIKRTYTTLYILMTTEDRKKKHAKLNINRSNSFALA